MELDIRQYLTAAKEQHDVEALQSAFRLFTHTTAAGKGRSPHLSPELYVVCAEAALQLGCLEISTACLKMYFEENPPADQILCRAYLCQGQLKSPPATGTVEAFEEAFGYFLEAIDISKQEPQFHFMVFNASVLYLQTVRPLLQQGRCFHLVSSLRKVVQSLEEVADGDHSWRAELMIHLIRCVVESGDKEEATDLAKTTAEFINSQAPHLYPKLFTIMVQHQLTEDEVICEMTMQDNNLAVINKIQEFKNRLEEINEDEPTKEDCANLEEIFHLLMDCANASQAHENQHAVRRPIPIQAADRVAFLLDLALLALRAKHHKVAADCLKELKLAKEATVGQRIIMECISSELNLLKKEAKMNDYSKASIEARLKEITRLHQWLQSAVKEGDPQAAQAVCATLWRFCLPLLQHNLRKHIKKPLLRVAKELEDMESSLLEIRCQIHSELAVIEEEEGHLAAASTQLQKAILLDNGTQSQRLSSAWNLLQLRGNLYQTPSRTEDKAAKLLQQVRDVQPQDETDIRPALVAVGLLLGSDDFQIVLDGDNITKIPTGSSPPGPLGQLAAKAQHHTVCLQKVEGHLSRQSRKLDHTERMRLWAALVKAARKQEVWDVCRAACRFCLLYDDGRWKLSKADGMKKDRKSDETRSLRASSAAESLQGCKEVKTSVTENLRLLAEIYFISAEATIQKLLTEGVQLNSPAIPPQEREVRISEEDPHWVIYRDWIEALSCYASSNFFRAAELGSDINELWVVANGAIYLWNYNSHLLTAGEYQLLLPSFQTVVEELKKTESSGNRTMVVLLCNVVAHGLIQSLNGRDPIKPPAPEKVKGKAEKGGDKNAAASVEHAAAQIVRKALELCDYAFRISNCNSSADTVPIAARKQLVATWVKTKKLLQQQIGPKIEMKDECVNEDVMAMTRVLVAVEMLQCNKIPGQMEFSVPSLPALVSMASECSWTDAVVELQVWCQLAAFCHDAKDHSLVLCCTKNALQLEETAARSISTMPCALYAPTAVDEMLSITACLRGLSLIHEANGDLCAYKKSMKVLQSSVSFAEKAESPTLCVTAARHYWNSCLPVTLTPEDRRQFKDPLEKILNALVQTTTKHAKKQVAQKNQLTPTALPHGRSKPGERDEDGLTLRAAIYSFLLHIHADKSDWKSALRLLDKAKRDMPRTRHRIPLLKSRVLLKARLGESVLMDMESLLDEGEQCCSFMWHQVALCSASIAQQLAFYQRSITSLTSLESKQQKVNLMLEFGEWLYSNNFPKSRVQQQVQFTIDTLLHLQPEWAEGADEESRSIQLDVTEVEGAEYLDGLLGVFVKNLSNVRAVQRLDCLVQAYTLLAVLFDKTSPNHQMNLLRAYTLVLQIWKVSLDIMSRDTKSLSHQPPSVDSRKSKKKPKNVKDAKGKESPQTPFEERPKSAILDQTMPFTTKDWAYYMCPEQTREIFRTSTDPDCINSHSIAMQPQSLFYLNLLEKELQSLSLDHLTLPILHLAETIAHDLLDRKSLSDLYRLRILRTCRQLGLEGLSPYHEDLPDLCRIHNEQKECQKEIEQLRERRVVSQTQNQRVEMDKIHRHGRQTVSTRVHDILLDKAEVCRSMEFHQQAQKLLTEACAEARVFGDQRAIAMTLLGVASLACKEQNYIQALILLDEAQTLGGDERFWYQFTLGKVRVVTGLGLQDAQAKVDSIMKEGSRALKHVQGLQVNKEMQLTFLMTSLEMRVAMERIRAFGNLDPGEMLSAEVIQRLMSTCKTLRACADTFTKLNYRQQAAEAQAEYAHCVRFLASHTTDREEKRRFLLDGLYHMQLVVMVQEKEMLNVQNLLPPQEETQGICQAPMRRLLGLRLVLAEFCLALLQECCAEEKRQSLSRGRMTSAEIVLEEFTRCTPVLGTIEQEWLSVASTLGQVALGQLAVVGSHSTDNVETRAHYLCLMGKYLTLMAAQDNPRYLCALWEGHKHKETRSDTKTTSGEDDCSAKEKGSESSRKEKTFSAKSAELQHKRQKQLVDRATQVFTEAAALCLKHKLPSSLLAEISICMLGCLGQSDPAVAGQYLALYQSCCAIAMISEILNPGCADTRVSQLSALHSLCRKLLGSQEERPSGLLKGADSLDSLSKASNQLVVNSNHLHLLAELKPRQKILLLQHSEDGSELYGAFYDLTKGPEVPKGKMAQQTGNLVCTRLAKVSVCPQALLALRERIRAIGQETSHVPQEEERWRSAEGALDLSGKPRLPAHKHAPDEKSSLDLRKIVQDMEKYLNPLLVQFYGCLSLLDVSSQSHDTTKSAKEKEEKKSLTSEQGNCLVLLADRKLQELPLESLSMFQDVSLTQDFSLQLLHSRMVKEEPEKVVKEKPKR